MSRDSRLTQNYVTSNSICVPLRPLMILFLMAGAQVVSASQSETISSTRCDMVLRSKSLTLESLQNPSEPSKKFARQRDIDPLLRKGGSCGIVCAINLIQELKVSSGQFSHDDPIEMAKKVIRNIPSAVDGGVVPARLHEFLKYLLKNYASESLAQVESKQLKLKDSLPESNIEFSKITLETIRSEPNEFKIILIWSPLMGGHFIFVKSTVGNKLSAIEPNEPEKLTEFNMETIFIQDHDNIETVRLVPSDGNPLKFDAHTSFVVLAITTVRTLRSKLSTGGFGT